MSDCFDLGGETESNWVGRRVWFTRCDVVVDTRVFFQLAPMPRSQPGRLWPEATARVYRCTIAQRLCQQSSMLEVWPLRWVGHTPMPRKSPDIITPASEGSSLRGLAFPELQAPVLLASASSCWTCQQNAGIALRTTRPLDSSAPELEHQHDPPPSRLVVTKST